MKKILTLAAAALLMGSVAFAQHREGDGHLRVEEKTERMAERYGLSDHQKAQLLELNRKQAEGALSPAGRQYHGDLPPRPEGAPEGARGAERPPFPGGEAPQHPGHGQFRHGDGPQPGFVAPDGDGPTRADLKAEQKEYQKALRAIMTKDQYKLYKQDLKAHRKARKARRH